MEPVEPSRLCSQMDNIINTINATESVITESIKYKSKALDQKIKSVTKEITHLEATKLNKQQDIEQRDITLKELEKKIVDLSHNEISLQAIDIKLKKEAILKVNADLKTQVMEKRALLEEREKHNRMIKTSAKENTQRIIAELNACISQLQLDIFTEKENYIKCVFKCIDPTDPKKMYYFVLYLAESGRYNVIECNPELPDIESLVHRLNTDRDLYAFIKLMRLSFVKID